MPLPALDRKLKLSFLFFLLILAYRKRRLILSVLSSRRRRLAPPPLKFSIPAGMEPTEITVPIRGGLTIGVRVWKSPISKPGPITKIFALHGWLDNANTFDLLAPMLLEQGNVEIYSVDAPGHGFSSHRPAGCAYYFYDYIADMVYTMDALGLQTCVLMGHSMGGSIASILAGTFPERVEKVILIEAIGPAHTEEKDIPDELAKVILRKEPSGKSKVHKDREAAAIRLGEGLTKVPLEAARILCIRGCKDVIEDGKVVGVTWRTDPALMTPSRARLTPGIVDSFFRRVRAPVLLITPKDGFFAPGSERFERTHRIQTLLQSTKVTHVIPESGGHHIHLTKPKVVFDAIQSFLQS